MGETEEREMSVFLDVFRRADKNDDGMISWEEFRSYFADGVMSEDELRKLFHEIDTHNTDNIDCGELSTYFSHHLGAFRDLFHGLEDMNKFVSSALATSAQSYSGAPVVEQFTTRFLLREVTNQLAALQRPLDVAADTLDERELENSTDSERQQLAVCEESPVTRQPIHVDSESCDQVAKGSITPGRVARRQRKALSTQTSWTVEKGMSGGALNQQVDRLRSLLDRLENKVNLGSGPEEEVVNGEENDLLVVVSRRMQVADGHEKAFRNSLRNYIEAVNKLDSSLSISVRSFTSSPTVCLYEVWKSPQDWTEFSSSTSSKAFRHGNVDHLSVPEQLTSIKLPGNWWSAE